MRSQPYHLAMILFLGAFCPPAWASDWEASFSFRPDSRQLFRIDLPADLDLATLTRLVVELDSIDVTAYLSFDGANLAYSPAEPLVAGEHQVRLVLLNPDGSTKEKDSWRFSTQGASSEPAGPVAQTDAQQLAAAERWIRSGSYSTDNAVEFSRRAMQHNIDGAPPRSVASGAGVTAGEVAGQTWQIKTHANYFLQSDRANSLTGETLDIGEFNIAATHQGEQFASGLNLGHHSIGLDSLLFAPQQRRGLSIHAGDEHNRLSTQLFSLRSNAIVGARNFTGLADSTSRMEGFSATIKPFSTTEHALTVTTMYFDGEGRNDGEGIVDNGLTAAGSGWGVLLEKGLWQGKLNVRGEYARSSHDPDGRLGPADRTSGDALNLILEARPFSNLVWANTPANVVIGAEYHRLDTYFGSLANPGLAVDRKLWTAFSHLHWGGLSANMQYNHETNNVDRLQGMPTDRLRSLVWSGNYAFDPLADDRHRWLGTPYVHVSGSISRLDRRNTPENYAGFETDNAARSMTLGGGSSHERWHWALSHTYAEFEGRNDSSNDSTSRFLSLSAGWRHSEHLSFNSDVQYGVFSTGADDRKEYSTNLNVGVQSVLIPSKLDWSLNYNLNLAGGSSDLPDRHVISTQVGWTLLKPSRSKPGVALAVRGSLENNRGNNTQNTERDKYQVFVVLRITGSTAGGF